MRKKTDKQNKAKIKIHEHHFKITRKEIYRYKLAGKINTAAKKIIQECSCGEKKISYISDISKW